MFLKRPVELNSSVIASERCPPYTSPVGLSGSAYRRCPSSPEGRLAALDREFDGGGSSRYTDRP